MLSGSAATDRQLDELHGHVVQIRDRAERVVQRLRADHVRQAVGAEQIPVTGHGLAHGQVRLRLPAPVERPQDQRPLRMGGGLLLAEPPLVDQRLHERMIVGDLVQLAVAEHVAARVADMAQRIALARPQHGRQRGPHALHGGVGGRHLMQGVAGRVDRFLQRARAGHRWGASSIRPARPPRRWPRRLPPRRRHGRPCRPRRRAGGGSRTPSLRFLRGEDRRRSVPRSGVQVSSAQFQNGLADTDRHARRHGGGPRHFLAIQICAVG